MPVVPTATACRVCLAQVSPPTAVCFCCATLTRQLRMPLVPVAAIAEFQPGDLLHRRLRGYKDAPVAERRAGCTRHLVGMLAEWLASDRARAGLSAAGWGLVATVPSSVRPARDPVAGLVGGVPELAGSLHSLLERGPAPTGHLRASRRGFALRPGTDPVGMRGRRVLLVEDCVVTGARAQSAAAALRLAGARVVGVVALGRLASSRTRT